MMQPYWGCLAFRAVNCVKHRDVVPTSLEIWVRPEGGALISRDPCQVRQLMPEGVEEVEWHDAAQTFARGSRMLWEIQEPQRLTRLRTAAYRAIVTRLLGRVPGQRSQKCDRTAHRGSHNSRMDFGR